MHRVRKDILGACHPLRDIFDLPLYGFQFFFRHIDHFRRSFWILTAIRMVSALLKFYATFVISNILSNVTLLTPALLFKVYLPQFVGAIIVCEILDYYTRRFAEELPSLYSDYATLRFFVTWLSLRSTRLQAISKERLQQLTSKYLEGVQSFLGDWTWRIPSEFTQLLIVCVLLGIQSPLVLLVNIVVMLLYFFISFYNSRRFSSYWEAFLRTSVSSRTFSQSVFTQLTTAQRLSAMEELKSVAADHAIATGMAMQEVKRFHGYRWLIQLIFFNLVYATTFFIGVYQVITGTLPLGFLVLIKWAYDSLWSVMQYLIEAYVQLIGQKENALFVRREFQALGGYFPSRTISLPVGWKSLEVHDAYCEYDLNDGEKVSIEIREFRLQPGTRVSLAGSSGSGKTTVLHMLMNLVEFRGRYELDGESIRDTYIAPSSIALVTAADGFFPISIRDNLTLGRSVTDSELRRILQGLQIDFIANMDEKFGERIAFSAGQLQRLRLARGLLTNAKVLLLDEPFTGVDETNKGKISLFLDRELCGKTVVFVTHDSSELLTFRIDSHFRFEGHRLIKLEQRE